METRPDPAGYHPQQTRGRALDIHGIARNEKSPSRDVNKQTIEEMREEIYAAGRKAVREARAFSERAFEPELDEL
jgi:hypothetical protein